METALKIALVFLNNFSIIMSIKMLKGFEKVKIFTYLLVGEITMFILCNIIYALTSSNVPADVHQASKWMILLTILPINMMVLFCPVASLINKKTFDEITEDVFKKRIIIMGIITILIIVFEISYTKNIQLDIANIANKAMISQHK